MLTGPDAPRRFGRSVRNPPQRRRSVDHQCRDGSATAGPGGGRPACPGFLRRNGVPERHGNAGHLDPPVPPPGILIDLDDLEPDRNAARPVHHAGAAGGDDLARVVHRSDLRRPFRPAVRAPVPVPHGVGRGRPGGRDRHSHPVRWTNRRNSWWMCCSSSTVAPSRDDGEDPARPFRHLHLGRHHQHRNTGGHRRRRARRRVLHRQAARPRSARACSMACRYGSGSRLAVRHLVAADRGIEPMVTQQAEGDIDQRSRRVGHQRGPQAGGADGVDQFLRPRLPEQVLGEDLGGQRQQQRGRLRRCSSPDPRSASSMPTEVGIDCPVVAAWPSPATGCRRAGRRPGPSRPSTAARNRPGCRPCRTARRRELPIQDPPDAVLIRSSA